MTAPEEHTFPFNRPTLFRSLERADHRLLVDPHRLRAAYLEQFEKFQGKLAEICSHAGVDLVRLTTAMPYAKALGEYLDARARRKTKR